MSNWGHGPFPHLTIEQKRELKCEFYDPDAEPPPRFFPWLANPHQLLTQLHLALKEIGDKNEIPD